MKNSSVRKLFFAIELNLVLWIIAAAVTRGNPFVLAGLILAVVVQHWAYYDIYKRIPK